MLKNIQLLKSLHTARPLHDMWETQPLFVRLYNPTTYALFLLTSSSDNHTKEQKQMYNSLNIIVSVLTTYPYIRIDCKVMWKVCESYEFSQCC
jgi:hypothetical protein